MRFLICDDQPEITRIMERYLREYFTRRKLPPPEFAVYQSGEALLAGEADKPPADMAFLDVEMPGISGIHLGARLREKNPRLLVFIVTSFPDHLDEAMEHRVFRYLTKPIDKERLHHNLKSALALLYTLPNRIPVETPKGIVTLEGDDILCVEAKDRKVYVHTAAGTLESVKSLEYWRTSLTSPCFYSPHRSYIIHLGCVSRIDKTTVHLSRGEWEMDAYLTMRKYNECRTAYLTYLDGLT